jgi:hypothetical protein
MNGTCSFAKQISAALGITSAGAITTTSGAITSASTVSGTTITASTGLVGAYQNKASSATASITTAGVITGASLGLGTGAITCGAISSSGLITADGGITIPSGDILQVSGTLKTSSLDAIADAAAGSTALTIGSNIVEGNIEIGGALTTGDITIGKNNISGATVTIGTSTTSTTINGRFITTNGTIAGYSAYIGVSTYPYTLSTTVNTNVCLNLFSSVSSSTITIPAISGNYPAGQVIMIKNSTLPTHELITNNSFFPKGASAAVTSFIIPSYGAIVFFASSSVWLQVA